MTDTLESDTIVLYPLCSPKTSPAYLLVHHQQARIQRFLVCRDANAPLLVLLSTDGIVLRTGESSSWLPHLHLLLPGDPS